MYTIIIIVLLAALLLQSMALWYVVKTRQQNQVDAQETLQQLSARNQSLTEYVNTIKSITGACEGGIEDRLTEQGYIEQTLVRHANSAYVRAPDLGSWLVAHRHFLIALRDAVIPHEMKRARANAEVERILVGQKPDAGIDTSNVRVLSPQFTPARYKS